MKKLFGWADKLHLLLWIAKDSSWYFKWSFGALFFSSLAIVSSILLLLSTKEKMFRENLVLCLWILANTFWMVSELVAPSFHFLGGTFFFLSYIGIVWMLFSHQKQ
jgi:hypothetical protein